MLEVIEHQQQMFFAKIIEELCPGVSLAIENELERIGDSRHNEIWGRERLKGYEIYTVRETDLLCCLNGEACFANAPRPGQRQQPTGWIGYELLNVHQFFFPSDQRGRRRRKISYSHRPEDTFTPRTIITILTHF